MLVCSFLFFIFILFYFFFLCGGGGGGGLGTKCVLWKLMHTGSIDFYNLILRHNCCFHVTHYYRTYYLWKHLYHLPFRYFDPVTLFQLAF